MFLKNLSNLFLRKKKIDFETVKDLSKAKQWWDHFTPRETIYDEWDFRYYFYKYFNYELFFYVGYVGDEPIGLLASQLNTKEGYKEFFGGNLLNDSRVFILPGYESCAADFYHAVESPFRFSYISEKDPFGKTQAIIDHQYNLPLQNLRTIEDYITIYYQGETRKKFLKRFKEAESVYNGLLVNNSPDIELMFEYNVAKFKDKSAFLAPHRQEIFRDLLSSSFEPTLLTYMVNHQKQAVSFGLIYNKHFVSLNSGIRPDAHKEISSLSRLKRIEYAIKAGCISLDAGTGDCGWKESWKFTKIPQYIFEKK